MSDAIKPDQDPEFERLLAVGHELADLAGQHVLGHFRSSLDVDNKAGGGDFDPVTLADQGGEKVIRERLQQVFPTHGIIGEEFGAEVGDSDYQWIIDPVDGTRAFIMGFTAWGILIGLMKDGAPVLGLMDQPFTKERYWRTADGSHYRGPDGEFALKVRDCKSLDKAFLATTSPDFLAEGFETTCFMALKAQSRLTRYGGDCYSYCLLAAGHIDLVVEAGLKPHDIMPLIPIIEGAGGIVTTWDGGDATKGGRIIAAGSRSVHAQSLEILRS